MYVTIVVATSHVQLEMYPRISSVSYEGSLNRYHYQVGFSHGFAGARRVREEPRTPRPPQITDQPTQPTPVVTTVTTHTTLIK